MLTEKMDQAVGRLLTIAFFVWLMNSSYEINVQ